MVVSRGIAQASPFAAGNAVDGRPISTARRIALIRFKGASPLVRSSGRFVSTRTLYTPQQAFCAGPVPASRRGKVPLGLVPMDTFPPDHPGGILSPSRSSSIGIRGGIHEQADRGRHSHRAPLSSGHASERRRDELLYGSAHDMRAPRRMCGRGAHERSPDVRCRFLLPVRTATDSIQPPRPRQLIPALGTCRSECGASDGARSSQFDSPSFQSLGSPGRYPAPPRHNPSPLEVCIVSI